MDEFGERLRRLRGNRSQKEVAALLDMPITTYSTLENQDAVPRGPVLKRLADCFAVPISYFYPVAVPELQSTASARTWLETLRSSSFQDDKVAAHAGINLEDEAKATLAERISAIKNAKSSHKSWSWKFDP
jgi:transcriptional regulator with XRE-family HTH domain